MQWTNEQAPAIASNARKLLIQAFAGTGKTTTLVGYANAHSGVKMLYLCYNKSVEMVAKNRFPQNVTCKTAHGLAYAVYGTQYQHKQAGNLRITEVARVLDTQDWELARDVVNTLNTFMASSDMALDGRHFTRFEGRGLTPLQERRVTQVVGLAISVWKRMIDLQDKSVQITHDGYLKLYQMSRPDLSNRFEAILLDEGQDVNPVIADLVQRQRTTRVMVGDPHQQLYRFRGAENALSAPWMADAEKHYLTQSFRFGPAVAHVANVILSFKGETVKLQGLGQRTLVKRSLPEDLPHRTWLHRTVGGVIENALRLEKQGGQRMFWIGGIDSYSLRELEDLFQFSRGRNDLVQQKKLLKDYRDYEQYQEIAQATQDPEMQRSVRIIEAYFDLPKRIEQLRRCAVASELDATVTLTTAHKAKGLEWDYVGLYDDFSADPLAPEIDRAKRDDELNLLYVSVTRAMQILALNSLVIDIMQRYKELHGSLVQ
ncbi:DNA helicase [Pseudomonas oryzihabitans]|nr:DNA helicase [Pseudomonas psychrotolerans]KTT40021.1 DNA helicase [Pseudomonas psychrotolerans]KTT43799.1 DNA helicase [Pseudomonas psychrotolerans]KTT64535.1 DNA helicase [Pseudomonas psychrotolerans]